MHALKVFEIRAGRVEAGVALEKFEVAGGEVSIPAIIVGERGRGRRLGIVPVQLPVVDYERWQAGEEVRLMAATVGQTKRGAPKLLQAIPEGASEEAYIGVFRTPIGFRGRNYHTGDFLGWECITCKTHWEGEQEVCPECGAKAKPVFDDWPGENLVVGVIAQGAAGMAGSGTQVVAVVPAGVVVRTGYSGRLYGKPPSHYYLYRGGRLLAATWQERLATDIF